MQPANLIRDLEQIGVEVDAEALAAGVLDLVSQSELQLSDEEMQTVLQEYQQELEKEQEAMQEQSRQMTEEFVSNFSELEGVQKTDSGILYRIVEEGAGDKPKAEDTVVVHYRGSLVNGTVFDSSYEREQPATFSLQGIIIGLARDSSVNAYGVDLGSCDPAGTGLRRARCTAGDTANVNSGIYNRTH